jgi:hypothetical protein
VTQRPIPNPDDRTAWALSVALWCVVAVGALLGAGCSALANAAPPCDRATYLALEADCLAKVRVCDGRAGACPELTECEKQLKDREAQCLR